jgi:ABC-type polysaccharide/polyol phosphate export permease
MSAPLEILRASFSGIEINVTQTVISILSSLVMLVTGLVYFRKTEAYFADLA